MPNSSKRAKGAPTFDVTELLVKVPKMLLLKSKPVLVVSSVTAPNDWGGHAEEDAGLGPRPVG